MSRFDSRSEDEDVSFAPVMLVVVVDSCVLSLNDFHSLSREIYDEREAHTMGR